MEFFKTNQNNSERVTRFIISLFLLPAPIIFGISNYAIVLCGFGGILLFNSIVGTCFIYKFFGVNTCKVN
tara:strand:+ start:485 stop:694 length:210 start_codon:yes stop_codon:yes gene_type:complete